MITSSFSPQDIALALSQGDLVVLRTDTIYGILASATLPKAFEKLYSARNRPLSKASILLVADPEDIPHLTTEQRNIYQTLSNERPTTIVQSVDDNYLPHLPREGNTLAFRVITLPHLRELIRLTGPLLAPSANPEGQPPATTVRQAMEYFGDKVSLYVDGGQVTKNTPSRIVKFVDGAVQIIR